MVEAGDGEATTEARAAALLADERYRRLVGRRARFAWLLTTAMLAIYFGFILLVAFARDWLSQPIGEGVTSLGIPLGIGVILAAVALTGVYVRRANREFDPAIAALQRDYGR